jgi:hypothetical protein
LPVPSEDNSVWRSTINAAYKSGTLACGGTEPEASDASSKSPDL